MSKSKKNAKSKEDKSIDFMRAIKKADREIELEHSNGFVSKHKVHKSAKAYSRKPKFKGELGF